MLRRRLRLGPADGDADRLGELQGLHPSFVAAAALRLPGSKLRLITPQDSGGSFGIKSAVYAYVVLIGLAARRFGVPCAGPKTAEHLAASSASTARVTELEAGFSAEGELVALRYDAIEDVGHTCARSRRRCTGCTAH